MKITDFTTLVGKTFQAIETKGEGDNKIKFITTEGDKYLMLHDQDCCETVDIEEIIGDLSDLINTPILVAEERTSHDEKGNVWGEYGEWTFYELRTIKGSVTIRWYGSSNGYYATDVSFYKV